MPITPINTPSPTNNGSSGGGNKKAAKPLRETIPVLGQLGTITTGLVSSISTANTAWDGFGQHLEIVKEKAAALREVLTPMQSAIISLGDAIGEKPC